MSYLKKHVNILKNMSYLKKLGKSIKISQYLKKNVNILKNMSYLKNMSIS